MTLEQNSRWVKDSDKNPQPEWSTFAVVVSRERIIIALTYDALDELPVFGADIKNDYLKSPSLEKHQIICGPKFGLDNEGKIAIIVQALYGWKSSGAGYWHHARAAMADMHFESCKADPYVFMIPEKKSHGTLY